MEGGAVKSGGVLANGKQDVRLELILCGRIRAHDSIVEYRDANAARNKAYTAKRDCPRVGVPRQNLKGVGDEWIVKRWIISQADGEIYSAGGQGHLRDLSVAIESHV